LSQGLTSHLAQNNHSGKQKSSERTFNTPWEIVLSLVH